MAGNGRTLFARTWDIPGPVSAGDPLRLEYRYDENQTLEMRLTLSRHAERGPCRFKIENPLTHVVNPAREEEQIEALEEDLRTGKIPASEQVAHLIKLARLYASPTINQKEKALDILRRVHLRQSHPNAEVLNLMGLYAGDLGDIEREAKYLLDAAAATSWTGPLFNLALAHKRQGHLQQAIETIDQALGRERAPTSLVFRALLADIGREQEFRDELLKEAVQGFNSPPILEDWELYWYEQGARLAGNKTAVEEARQERVRRQTGPTVENAAGLLPAQAARIVRRDK